MPLFIVVIALIILVITMLISLMSVDETEDAWKFLLGSFIGVVAFGLWLLIAGSQPYTIVSQKTVPVVVDVDGQYKRQYIEGSTEQIDVFLTFGQTFPVGSIVQETQIDPVIGGIDWEPHSVYLYEVIAVPTPVTSTSATSATPTPSQSSTDPTTY